MPDAPGTTEAIKIIQTRQLAALKGITDEMAKQIIEELTRGILVGESVSQLAARIEDRVDKIGITRTKTMARTETISAFNNAALNRYKGWGVEKVEWLTGGDPCEICSPLGGQIYKLGNEPALPQHPNCVCTVAPVSEYTGSG